MGNHTIRYAIWAFEDQGSATHWEKNEARHRNTRSAGDGLFENGYKEEVTFELDVDFFLLAWSKLMESASLV